MSLLLTRFVAKSRLVATDTYALASSLLSARPTSIPSARDVLIRSSRKDNGNIVATSVLRLDREIGLVRYHGLGGYVNAKGGIRGLLVSGNGAALTTRSADSSGGFNLTRFLFGPPSGRGRDSSEASTGTDVTNNSIVSSALPQGSHNQKKARVAFMITSAQRMQLTSQLGYTATDIKSLRPLEVLLILEHGIEPGNDGEVRRLVAENEALEEEEARRAEKELAEAKAAAAEAAAIAEAQPGTSSDEQLKMVEQVHPDDPKSSSVTQRESTDETRLALASGSNDGTSEAPSPTPIQQDSSTSLSGSISHQSTAVQQALSRPLAGDKQKKWEDGCPTEKVSNNSEENIWYEVVETSKSLEEMSDAASSSTGESTVVALYQTLEEAEDCLEWKEQRGKSRYKYEIRER
mmetsp:Transcript_32317/g.65572  ORF Transcript_32317/g.65572 Transcript_32317/m.65572 type:complete len:406 (+) Transcript_32317:217-1434(+)